MHQPREGTARPVPGDCLRDPCAGCTEAVAADSRRSPAPRPAGHSFPHTGAFPLATTLPHSQIGRAHVRTPEPAFGLVRCGRCNRLLQPGWLITASVFLAAPEASMVGRGPLPGHGLFLVLTWQRVEPLFCSTDPSIWGGEDFNIQIWRGTDIPTIEAL